MNTHRRAMAVLGVAVLIGLARPAGAGWNRSTGGTYGYSDPANWVGGVIDHQFTNALDAAQTIQLTAATAASNLTYAVPSVAANPTVAFKSSSGPFTLSLSGTTRFVPYRNVNSPLLTFGSATAGEVVNIGLSGSSPVVGSEHPSYAASTLLFYNTVSGSGGLTKTGRGLLQLNGANTWPGALNVLAGGVRLAEANGALTCTNITLAPGAMLELYNGNAVNNNRLPDHAIINLNGGFWPASVSGGAIASCPAFSLNLWDARNNGSYANLLAYGRAATEAVTENVAAINLQSGLSRVVAQVYGAGASYGNVTLTANHLTRAAGSAVIFSGDSSGANALKLGGELPVGAQTYIKFNNAPALSGGILPYALVGWQMIQQNVAYELATYSGADGIVRFGKTGVYCTNITGAAAASNVLTTATGETWTGPRTMNSLNLRNIWGGTFGSGAANTTITLLSGALVSMNYYGSTVINAPLDFNNQEGFIYSAASKYMDFNRAMTNISSAGINFIGTMISSGLGDVAGGFRLNNAALALTKPARVLMGTLIPLTDSLANCAVTVCSGGTLALNNNARNVGSLAGEGTVRLSGLTSGTSLGTLVVGGDNSSTVFSGSIHAGQWMNGAVMGFGNTAVKGGHVIKTGTGSLTLSGLSTYTGTNTVRQGALLAGADAGASTVYGVIPTPSTTTPLLNNKFSGPLTNSVANGDKVIFGNAYYPPGGFSWGRIYFVVNSTVSNFQISATSGGVALTALSCPNSPFASKLDPAQLATGSGDTLTLPSGTVANGNAVVFTAVAGTTLISGIPYYVRDAAGSSFKVSLSPGGPVVGNLPSVVSVVRPGAFGSGTTAVEMGDTATGSHPLGLTIAGPYTIERDVKVNNFGAGTTLGGTTNAVSHFTGTITLSKAVNLSAAAGGTVHFNTLGGRKITGAGAVNITGAGAVMLGGTNDYTGLTTVKAGAALGGTGTIPAGLTFEAGGKLAVTLTPDPNDYVPLKVNGTVDASDATVAIAPLTFTPSIGLTYTLIANDGTDAVTGSFEPRLLTLTYNGKEHTAAIQQGGDGNDVVLQVVARGTVISIR